MRFLFTYKLQGEGDTEEQALFDALESFQLDPGDPSETEQICETNEYFFYIGECKDYYLDIPIGLRVVFCSIDYFKKNGHIEDSYMKKEVKRYLPSYMSEDGRHEFEIDLPTDQISQVREVLLTLGFLEDKNFSDFASTHDPFC